MDISQDCVTRNQCLLSPEHPKHISYKLGKCTEEDSICSQSGDLTSSNEPFCLQVSIQCVQANAKIPITSHLITNLAYKLKPLHKRNQYLIARLDICANVNIMPASICKLVFHDPELVKLAPSKLAIGTYTTNAVKLVGYCFFLLCTSRYQASTRSDSLCCK